MPQRVLLVSDFQEYRGSMETALARENHPVEIAVSSDCDLCALVCNRAIDLLILHVNAMEPAILQQLHKLNQQLTIPIVMFVNHGDSTAAVEATKAGVCAFIVDGLQPQRIGPIVSAALARFAMKQQLQQALTQAQTSLRDRKIIERAKGLVMQQHHCSEAEAYQALRKLAMDRNRRLADVAEAIIDTSSLMS